MDQRTGQGADNNSSPDSGGRFYNLNGQWWFAVNNGMDQGPFQSRPRAKQAMLRYLIERVTI